jgi:hypothetical protein
MNSFWAHIPMKAALYVRTSTVDQTVGNQVRKLEAVAERLGHERKSMRTMAWGGIGGRHLTVYAFLSEIHASHVSNFTRISKGLTPRPRPAGPCSRYGGVCRVRAGHDRRARPVGDGAGS